MRLIPSKIPLRRKLITKKRQNRVFRPAITFSGFSGFSAATHWGKHIRLRRMPLAGAELDGYTREDMYNTAVTGFEQMKEFGF